MSRVTSKGRRKLQLVEGRQCGTCRQEKREGWRQRPRPSMIIESLVRFQRAISTESSGRKTGGKSDWNLQKLTSCLRSLSVKAGDEQDLSLRSRVYSTDCFPAPHMLPKEEGVLGGWGYLGLCTRKHLRAWEHLGGDDEKVTG